MKNPKNLACETLSPKISHETDGKEEKKGMSLLMGGCIPTKRHLCINIYIYIFTVYYIIYIYIRIYIYVYTVYIHLCIHHDTDGLEISNKTPEI